MLEHVERSVYSHEHLAIEMAKSGHGIALALDVLVMKIFTAGSPIRPFCRKAAAIPTDTLLIHQSH